MKIEITIYKAFEERYKYTHKVLGTELLKARIRSSQSAKQAKALQVRREDAKNTSRVQAALDRRNRRNRRLAAIRRHH